MLAGSAALKLQSSPVEDKKILDYYNQWFEIIPADTPALRAQAYRLRYQVYCCEHKYETPDEHPHQLEEDAFDCRSIHSLVRDRASGIAAGTVRLILPDLKAPQSSLPIQNVCRHPLLSYLDTSYAAEVSRFAISKEARKTLNGSVLNAIGNHGTSPVAAKDLTVCFISLGLMRATVQMSFAHSITEWFAVMEPALLRLLRSFGIYFKPLGPLVQYHGLRQPCHANLSDILESVREEHFDLWDFVTERGNWLAF
jgi:N-acyl amino acid synthase of PEP-CTERM/exosortase system